MSESGYGKRIFVFRLFRISTTKNRITRYERVEFRCGMYPIDTYYPCCHCGKTMTGNAYGYLIRNIAKEEQPKNKYLFLSCLSCRRFLDQEMTAVIKQIMQSLDQYSVMKHYESSWDQPLRKVLLENQLLPDIPEENFPSILIPYFGQALKELLRKGEISWFTPTVKERLRVEFDLGHGEEVKRIHVFGRKGEAQEFQKMNPKALVVVAHGKLEDLENRIERILKGGAASSWTINVRSKTIPS